MDKFFKSEKVDKHQIKDILKGFPPEALAKMIETVKGERPDHKSQPTPYVALSDG